MLTLERLQTPRVIIPATLLTITATMLLPLLVHSIPVSGAPLGARLLPIFIAPLIALFLFHPAVSVIASLLTPYLNQQLTGSPAGPMMLTLTLELGIFTGICLLLRKRFAALWFVAPLAYIAAKALTQVILKAGGFVATPPWSAFLPSLVVALPGLLLLLVANLLLVRPWQSR